ncbi:methyl-accepting chemotaxis protein [Neorhizobium huautlense]|uniref:Methyl-accepting chemotaxis protein n=1 Tax=Neorhizobium huautlense TaxID=67774 RepID=A0ABT9Q1T9_9HYPH|nr:HAMP domain-containing methyl-accepting chemotaxis protein [Neorhizobium huautlense]MDP9840410.1 methyl-accepting chemotaxis protein [Neorhizobium huautlense]
MALILPFVLMSIGAVTYLSVNYRHAVETYSAFIINDGEAEIDLAIASQRLVAIVYDGYKMLNDRQGSPSWDAAYTDIAESTGRLSGLFEQIALKMPQERQTIDRMKSSSDNIIRMVELGVAAAGAGDPETAKVHLSGADKLVAVVLPNMRDWINTNLKTIHDKTLELDKDAHETIFHSVLALGCLTVLLSVLSLWVTSRGIASPIEALRVRMLALADGETTTAIAGVHRKDEIGDMATAVAVFRTNAIEQAALEVEAADTRLHADLERSENEQRKAKDAADVQFAVSELAAGLSALSLGNIGHRITKPFVSDLDELRQNFNGSLQKLQQTLAEVGERASGISGSAGEVRSAADDLSRRTEQQAASVEETAAALEQITTTVRDAARRAEDSQTLVNDTRAGAEQSGHIVEEAVVAMNKIADSSSKMNHIITAIDDIAFQTNLLALNAGVEAARAGEAGKGFAVVAQEVRELAQRSATAAKEIKVLIDGSSQQVRIGVDLVDKTGAALRKIVEGVQDISRNVSAIAESSREQAIGLNEVNNAVNSIDQGTQQNAAMVEQSTAASRSLANDAQSLTALLSFFALDTERVVQRAPDWGSRQAA